MTVRVARIEERHAALTLLYRYLPIDDQIRRVGGTLLMLDRGELPAESLLVADGAGQGRGSILAVPLPGACGMLWPPQVEPASPALEDRLIARACRWLHERGCTILQVLAPPPYLAQHDCLTRHGFRHLGRLGYRRHPLQPVPAPDPAGPAFALWPFPLVGDRLGRTLLATYKDSLDFPELIGGRTLDDIFAGHRAGIVYDPQRWWLIQQAGSDAGVVLVGLIPETGDWDLSYLGLLPTFRGISLGRAVLAEILRRAQAAGVPNVVLAVDERNTPACRMYRAAGFLAEDSREVFLKLIAPSH